MAFHFKRRESVEKAVRRLGRKRVEKALECLKDCERVEAIHCARKEIKKARAVLQLFRGQIRRKAYCRITDLLRDAAGNLAAPRDAFVKVITLRNLVRHFKGHIAAGGLRKIQPELRTACEQEMKRFAKEKSVRSVERALRRVAKGLDRLNVGGKGWKALCPGVKATYCKGQQACQTALRDQSPENFHQWRKRAKALLYQVTLLEPLWPEQMEAMASELDQLGEYLGDDHDLAMLQRAVGDEGVGDAYPRELEILRGLMTERQQELRTAAMALGSRFYAEKPSAFCSRLSEYWQIWRREKKGRIALTRRSL